MNLDTTDLAANMLGAIKGVLSKKWPEVKDYAETETKKLAESLAMVEKLKLTNQITDEEAELHFNIQKNATRTVFLAIEGLGVLAAEQAINAALDVVSDTVNSALKFTLL